MTLRFTRAVSYDSVTMVEELTERPSLSTLRVSVIWLQLLWDQAMQAQEGGHQHDESRPRDTNSSTISRATDCKLKLKYQQSTWATVRGERRQSAFCFDSLATLMFSYSVWDDFSLVLNCKDIKEFRVVATEGETVYLKHAALWGCSSNHRNHEGLPSLMGRRLAPSAAASRCESQSFVRRSIVQTHTCTCVSSMRAWLSGCCLHLEVLRLPQQGCWSFPGSRSVSGWWFSAAQVTMAMCPVLSHPKKTKKAGGSSISPWSCSTTSETQHTPLCPLGFPAHEETHSFILMFQFPFLWLVSFSRRIRVQAEVALSTTCLEAVRWRQWK